ncbi:MAG: hypothetical protein RL885_10735 [Planctomycetota bacterium]
MISTHEDRATQEGDPQAESNGSASGQPTPSVALKELLSRIGEIRDYLGHYWAATSALAKLEAKRLAIAIALGGVALIALAGWLIASGLEMIEGTVGGLTALTGAVWAGQLLGGLLCFALLIGGVWGSLRFASRQAAKRARQEFEQRKVEQRRKHGRDVSTVSDRA